jgi:hypothetical protein
MSDLSADVLLVVVSNLIVYILQLEEKGNINETGADSKHSGWCAGKKRWMRIHCVMIVCHQQPLGGGRTAQFSKVDEACTSTKFSFMNTSDAIQLTVY